MEKLNKNIETALAAAHENVTSAQTKMKERYDKTSSSRELKPQDLALVLLPTEGGQLYAKWRGPYTVIRRCQNDNYEINVDGRTTILHMNCLRRYHQRTDGGSDNEADDGTQTVGMVISEEPYGEPWTLGKDVITNDADATGQPDSTPHDFCMGQQLTATQRQQMQQLLERYDNVFSTTPGTTHLAEHHIQLTDSIPVYQTPYRVPENMRDAVEKELTKMLDNGIIQYDYETNYNSPMVVVRKANGGIRICNNFIELNKKTVNQQYLMTDPNELLNRAAGFRYVTKLDQSGAFWQVPLAPESQKYTGFQTFLGPFSYRKLAMGLRCSSATYQRLMDKILRGMHKFAGTLLDDTIVFSITFEDHLEHVRQVLDRLREAGLTVNKAKCTFASNEVKIFGHLLKDGLIHPDGDKVAAIAEWKPPKTKKQLKSFLGLVGFFRQYLQDYAAIAFPLTEQLKGSERLKWGEPQQQAFDALKAALMSRPVLHPPDRTKPYWLAADASRCSISAILMQPSDNEGAPPVVVAYASRKLLDRETRYPIIELELLSIIWALQKFKHFLYGATQKTRVFSDHKPISWLNSLVKHSPRIARAALILADFDVDVTYIKGEYQIADALTRRD